MQNCEDNVFICVIGRFMFVLFTYFLFYDLFSLIIMSGCEVEHHFSSSLKSRYNGHIEYHTPHLQAV